MRRQDDESTRAPNLAHAFLGTPSEATADALAALEEQLAGACAAAEAAWPAVRVEREGFVRHLASSALEGEPAGASLSRFVVADLYLAYAASRGDGAALAALDALIVRATQSAVARFRRSSAFADEVCQAVREALLLVRDGGPPRIADYAGHGSLMAWLRVTALRKALTLVRRRDPSDASLDEGHDDFVHFGADPALAQLQERYGPRFKAAFQEGLRALSDRERTLLRLSLIDDLSVAEIAPIYGVHRATVARWIAQAKERVIDRAREVLTAGAAMSRDEFESMALLLRSQLDLSLDRLLA